MCSHSRQIEVDAHSRDCNVVSLIKDGNYVHSEAGYLPNIGIGNEDSLHFIFCADCGQIIDFEPVKVTFVKNRRYLRDSLYEDDLTGCNLYDTQGMPVAKVVHHNYTLGTVDIALTNYRSVHTNCDYKYIVKHLVIKDLFIDGNQEEEIF